MKKILILGGTNFIGRNLVETLSLTNDFEIHLFNRQRTQVDLFPNLSRIKGDRATEDTKQLSAQEWDYVVDLSCYYPHHLTNVLKYIGDVRRYIYISSCSVYDNRQNQSIAREESSAILDCTTEEAIDTSNASYGNRKAECERILGRSGLNHLILRPALVFGQYDPTDRFYYWLHQVYSENELLLPEGGKGIFSTTYVHDLVAAILLGLQSNKAQATYNIISQTKTSISQILELGMEALQKSPDIYSCSAEFLHQNKLKPWLDIPLWLEEDFYTYSGEAIKSALGLELKEFHLSFAETLKYYQDLQWPKPSYGIPNEKRLALVKKWKAQHPK